MNIEGTRFGTIDFAAEDVVTFDEGIIGFAKLQSYILVSIKPGSPFRWLQSLDEPALAFLVTEPCAHVPAYQPIMSDSAAESIGLTDETPHLLYTTAVIPKGSPQDLTLNLAAPIVINAITRKAKQLVLEDQAYTIKHRVFPEPDRAGEKQAA